MQQNYNLNTCSEGYWTKIPCMSTVQTTTNVEQEFNYLSIFLLANLTEKKLEVSLGGEIYRAFEYLECASILNQNCKM